MRIAWLIVCLIAALTWAVPADAQQPAPCVKSKFGANDEVGNLNYVS
jgi:hypothetical protein